MARVYLALTLGVPRPARIETLYGRDPRSRLRFSSRLTSGKRAVTNVAPIEVFHAAAALVECRLETGRTHQIRVHLAEQAGTPLLGDTLYTKSAPANPGRSAASLAEPARIAAALGRHALHARVLGFEHPITRQALCFEREPPEDFATALAALRRWAATPAPEQR
jgi:23S rRNA pseudouridine1911/1915/1917 synthase